MMDLDDEAVDGRRCLELLGVWCVYLEVLFSDMGNTERRSSFVVQRSRVLTMVMWSYGLNVSPPQKKNTYVCWSPPAPQNVNLFGGNLIIEEINFKEKTHKITRVGPTPIWLTFL